MAVEGVSVAWSDIPFTANPTWTRLDSTYPHLISGWTVSRGRQDELSRTQTGVATIGFSDPDGVLDPTNTGGPYYPDIRPCVPAAVGLQHAVTDVWYPIFRGHISSLNYEVDPSQQVTFGTIDVVDLFDLLSAMEVNPNGDYGQDMTGDPWFDPANLFYPGGDTCQERIEGILFALGFDAATYEIFTGNVRLGDTTVPPGTSVLAVIQDIADAEFPGLANVFVDKEGVIRFKGRQPRFRPDVVEYDVNVWKAGDGEAALADGNMAQIRRLEFNRSSAQIINEALALPQAPLEGFTEAQIVANTVTDTGSLTAFGTRSWVAEDLLTRSGSITGNNALEETRLFAQYYVDNYADSTNRVNRIQFRSIPPDDPRATATWNVLCRVELGDIIRLTVTNPGGGGFTAEDFFVDGITYDVQPLNPDYADVTLNLDVTPRDLYASNPFDDDVDP